MSVIRAEFSEPAFGIEKASVDSVKQFLLKGNLRKAEQAARQLVQFNTKHTEALELLGLCLLQQGNALAATPFLEQALEQEPSNPNIAYNLAGAYYSIQEWEKACASYRYTIKLSPQAADAHKGLGASLYRLGRLNEAEEVYIQALEKDPEQIFVYLDLAGLHDDRDGPAKAIEVLQKGLRHVPSAPELHQALGDRFLKLGDQRNAATAFYNSGVCLQRRSNPTDAIQDFKRCLQLNPDNAKARYSLGMLRGDNLPSPPREYVVDLFNEYAGRFDRHLDQMNYQVPQHLYAAIQQVKQERSIFHRVLDLGCGTGKCGVLFKSLSKSLVGVDLAPKMLEVARHKRIYDKLITAEAIDFLRRTGDRYDLVIAADVFIYLGQLEELFQQVAERMDQWGLLAFSTETMDEEGLKLQSSGRYAHNDAYIDALARATGFARLSHTRTCIRMQSRGPIHGSLFVYRFAGQ